MTAPAPYRWLRIGAIAVGAVALASCKSLTAPALLPAIAIAASDASAGSTPCETCGPRGRMHAARPLSAAGSACGVGGCPAPPCPAPGCAPPPAVPVVPVVGPCLVCDGDDHGKPARATRQGGLKNLTAGDTVARYRPADVEPLGDDDLSDVCLAASNCTCVYAPRFSSVRELLRPHEESMPEGPGGLTSDEHLDAAVDLLPVVARTHLVPACLARKAQPGLAVEERLPPLAVDQADLPQAEIDTVGPVEDVRDEQPEQTRLVQSPRMKVGFDVPVAWTCVSGAQVVVAGQAAEVIAADQGTATLRLEEPGRCELTLCKRAGSDTARVGEELDFTIFVLNSGDRALTDILLVDALPKRLAYVPGSADSSLPATIDTGTGDDGSVVVRWRLTGTLAPGAGGFVRFRTIVR